MSLLTRITHLTARQLLSPGRYMVRLHPGFDMGQPRVSLTFDDGPHPERTPRILDQLVAAAAPATFFLSGRQAQRYPDLVQRLVADGHVVGSHTWSHWSARRTACRQWLADVRRARDTIEQIVGFSVPLFRPPYGELTPRTLDGLLRDDFRIVQWSLDTRDFLAPTTWHLQKWFRGTSPEDGTILLMHDNRAITSFSLEDCLGEWRNRVRYVAIDDRADPERTQSQTDRRPARNSPALALSAMATSKQSRMQDRAELEAGEHA